MKLFKLLILAGAAYAGYIYYQRFNAISNIAGEVSHAGSDSEYSSTPAPGEYRPAMSPGNGAYPSGFGPNANLGMIGGIGGVGTGNRGIMGGDGFSGFSGTSSSSSVSPMVKNGMELLKASAKGDLDKITRLLGEKTKIDSRDKERRTPLIYAAWAGYDEICTRLIAAGANPDLQDAYGNNAYDYAAGAGRIETVQLLLKRTQAKDEKHYVGYATLIRAVLSGDPIYLPAKADIAPFVNRLSPENQTPLHIAASNGWLPMVEGLVARGASVHIANHAKQTPLHWAAWNNQHEVTAFLLAHGANHSPRDVTGSTPLMLAAEKNAAETVQVLLAKGAKKEVSNKRGQTAHIIAQDKGFKPLAELLQ